MNYQLKKVHVHAINIRFISYYWVNMGCVRFRAYTGCLHGMLKQVNKTGQLENCLHADQWAQFGETCPSGGVLATDQPEPGTPTHSGLGSGLRWKWVLSGTGIQGQWRLLEEGMKKKIQWDYVFIFDIWEYYNFILFIWGSGEYHFYFVYLRVRGISYFYFVYLRVRGISYFYFVYLRVRGISYFYFVYLLSEGQGNIFYFVYQSSR